MEQLVWFHSSCSAQLACKTCPKRYTHTMKSRAHCPSKTRRISDPAQIVQELLQAWPMAGSPSDDKHAHRLRGVLVQPGPAAVGRQSHRSLRMYLYLPCAYSIPRCCATIVIGVMFSSLSRNAPGHALSNARLGTTMTWSLKVGSHHVFHDDGYYCALFPLPAAPPAHPILVRCAMAANGKDFGHFDMFCAATTFPMTALLLGVS